MTDSGISESKRCPQCGAEFDPTVSPLGLCPACLLKIGASDPAIAPVVHEPASADPPTLPSSSVRPSPSRTWFGRASIAIAAIAAALVAAVFATRACVSVTPTGRLGVIRFNLPLPDDLDSVDAMHFAMSPDGSRLAVTAPSADGASRLWLRTLQSMEWRAIPKTEGAALPFWSPDSRKIGFFAERKLKAADVASGLTQSLCDAPFGRGATWGPDGTIVFAPAATGPLYRVTAWGGTPQQATALDDGEAGGETAHWWPHFLPDGRTVLFVAQTRLGSSDRERTPALHLVALDSGERKRLVEDAGAATFAQGVLLFVRGTALFAQSFDARRGEVVGDVQPISGAEQVGAADSGVGFSATNAGVLVHRVGDDPQRQLRWFDRTGRSIGEAAAAPGYERFSVASDGQRLVASRRAPNESTPRIWLIEFDRQPSSPRSFGPSNASSPLWLPDGRIAFVSRRGDTHDIYIAAIDRSGKEELLFKSRTPVRLQDASPDGRFVVYAAPSDRGGWDLWLVALDGDHKPHPLAQTEFNESEGRLSPDGRWLAYVSDESGRDEVYVRSIPELEARWQVSTDGGQLPRWRRDGRELFFQSANGNLLAVDVLSFPAFRSGSPRVLFPLRHTSDYAVIGGGAQILAMTRVEDRDRNGLQVIINWQDELRASGARE